MKASPRLRHLRSLTLTAACSLALAACSSSSPGGGTGGSSGTGGSHTGTGGANTGTGGANTGTGGANTGTGGANIGSGGSSRTGTGGSDTGAGGTTATGGHTGTGGATGAGGSNNGGTPGAGGSNNGGRGGAGTGGATAGTGGATAGTGGATATGGTTGGGGGGSGFCPSGAIFCADFEEANGVPSNSPLGTATFSDPSEYGSTFGGTMAVMGLDKTGPYAGAQSMKVYPSSSFSVRTLAIAVPQAFWVRLYIKSDVAIGQPDHNSFFGAGIDPDYSKGKFVEVSEQFNCVILNENDALYPTGTTCGANAALTANEWHCMAAKFDGSTGNVQVFAGATKIIDATAWAPAKQAFTTFSFGYFAYNPNGATVWYDNVVVSTNPLSCP